jgi:Fe-S cluster assembly ATP-binding protein
LLGLIVSRYKHNPNNTAVIITHNEKIIPICDEILVVEGGTIAAQGTPDEIWHLIKDDIECKVRNQCQGEVTYGVK